jgi:hypothetical protein
MSAFTGALFCLYILISFENLIADVFVKVISLFVCSIIAFGKTKIKKLLLQSGCFVLFNI